MLNIEFSTIYTFGRFCSVCLSTFLWSQHLGALRSDPYKSKMAQESVESEKDKFGIYRNE